MKKNISLWDYIHLIKKTKDKQIKRDLKQIKKNILRCQKRMMEKQNGQTFKTLKKNGKDTKKCKKLI